MLFLACSDKYVLFLYNLLWLLLHHSPRYLYDTHIPSLSHPILKSYVSFAYTLLYMMTLLLGPSAVSKKKHNVVSNK